MLSTGSRRTTLFSSKLVFDKLNQKGANLLSHELIPLSIWMDTIAMHRQRVASLRRAVCNDDWRLWRVQFRDPAGDRVIDGSDLTAVHGERNDLINLESHILSATFVSSMSGVSIERMGSQDLQ